MTARLRALLASEVDGRLLGPARIVVGIAAIFRGLVAHSQLEALLAPHVLRMPYFPGLPYPSHLEVDLLAAVWIGAGVLFTIGLGTRLAGTALAAVSAYVLLLDRQTYSNHLYLLVLLTILLVIGRAGNALSLDARRRPAAPIPYYPVLLLRLQLSAVYGFAALAKLNLGFLSGAALVFYLLPARRALISEAAAPWILPALALLTVAVELFLAVAFWFRSWRRVAVVVGVLFHAGVIAGMAESPLLVIFALEMFALYTVFREPHPARSEPA